MMFDKMEEKFGLVPAMTQRAVVDVPVEKVETQEDITDKADRELARKTFRDLIEKSANMLSELMVIAESSEHPRAFEVASNLVKTISEVAGKLEDSASKKMNKKEAVSETSGDTHNHLYVGSSEELMKLIKNK